MTVHNEIVKRRPDLGAVMAAPWYMDRKGEVPEGKQPYFQIPIFNYFKVHIVAVHACKFCPSPRGYVHLFPNPPYPTCR